MTHTIGSHSDDRGETADFPCYCAVSNNGGEPEDEFCTELRQLLNKHSKENGSDTPDFVLAEYLNECLRIFDYSVRYRESTKTLIEPAEWGGVGDE